MSKTGKQARSPTSVGMHGLGGDRRRLDRRRRRAQFATDRGKRADETGFSFVQISDSHIGFESPPIRTRASR